MRAYYGYPAVGSGNPSVAKKLVVSNAYGGIQNLAELRPHYLVQRHNIWRHFCQHDWHNPYQKRPNSRHNSWINHRWRPWQSIPLHPLPPWPTLATRHRPSRPRDPSPGCPFPSPKNQIPQRPTKRSFRTDNSTNRRRSRTPHPR